MKFGLELREPTRLTVSTNLCGLSLSAAIQTTPTRS